MMLTGNEKKGKQLIISFLRYMPPVVCPMQLNCMVIERVCSYKLLPVVILQHQLGMNIATTT